MGRIGRPTHGDERLARRHRPPVPGSSGWCWIPVLRANVHDDIRDSGDLSLLLRGPSRTDVGRGPGTACLNADPGTDEDVDAVTRTDEDTGDHRRTDKRSVSGSDRRHSNRCRSKRRRSDRRLSEPDRSRSLRPRHDNTGRQRRQRRRPDSDRLPDFERRWVGYGRSWSDAGHVAKRDVDRRGCRAGDYRPCRAGPIERSTQASERLRPESAATLGRQTTAGHRVSGPRDRPGPLAPCVRRPGSRGLPQPWPRGRARPSGAGALP